MMSNCDGLIIHRRCEAVTCVDCSVTFYGDDFEAHTTCVSEAEKYEKSLHVPKKEKTNPQDIWIAVIEKAIENLKQAPKELQPYLQRIQEFSNIPRNKNKFTNFCKNSLRLFQEPVIAKLWTHLDTYKTQEKGTENGDVAEAKTVAAVVADDSQGTKGKDKKKAVTEVAVNGDGDDPVDSAVQEKKDKKKKKKRKEVEGEESAQQQEAPDNGEAQPAVTSEGMDRKKQKKDKKDKKLQV